MNFLVGVPDKRLAKYLEGKEYITASDEGEAVGIAGGYYLQTGKRATVFMSADGFCNALNPLTSWVMPEKIEMNFIISSGRQEPQHKVMSDILEKIINILPYDTARISITIIEE
jgi:sulfopyruvate decarboxylase TPP-binding subunit